MSTRSVSFETTLSSFGNNTGIEVPPDAIEGFGSEKSPAVVVDVNGYEYRNTVAVRTGKHLISVSAAVRKPTGLKGGDPIAVTLTLAEGPRPVHMPDDFQAALDANPPARAFFDGLSNSLQRYHCDTISGAKAEETRQRRIAKAVDLFVAGKQRDSFGPELRSASRNGSDRVPATLPGWQATVPPRGRRSDHRIWAVSHLTQTCPVSAPPAVSTTVGRDHGSWRTVSRSGSIEVASSRSPTLMARIRWSLVAAGESSTKWSLA